MKLSKIKIFKKVFSVFLLLTMIFNIFVINIQSKPTSVLDNKDTIEKIKINNGNYDLLIISPQKFKKYLQPLINHKTKYNIKTEIFDTKEIYNQICSLGRDKAEKIKYFIKDEIERCSIKYVLLVGGRKDQTDKETWWIPVRYSYLHRPYDNIDEKKFLSDLYFADIYDENGSFSDWDFDGDGKYAEYSTDMVNIDVHPDVYLGKLPANTPAEASDVVAKIINYKEHNKMTKKVMQIGGDSFTGDEIYEGEYANTRVLEKLPGYSTTQLWASTETLTKRNVANSFNDGVDFVDLCGHGSWASFATHPPNDDSVWVPPKTLISPYTGFLYLDYDLYVVANEKKLPVCVFKSCSNNKYSESPTCFGWKTVSKSNGGGIAVYAASGISYGAVGTDISERTTGWMEIKSFEELMSNKILGQVWANSISAYYNTFELDLDDADWKTLLTWSMFGDPTLVIEDGDDPEGISRNRPVFTNILEKILERPLFQKLLQRII